VQALMAEPGAGADAPWVAALAKALYRQGQALAALERWKAAAAALRKGLKLLPNEKGLSRALRRTLDHLYDVPALAALWAAQISDAQVSMLLPFFKGTTSVPSLSRPALSQRWLCRRLRPCPPVTVKCSNRCSLRRSA
jgi:hypothetical protein